MAMKIAVMVIAVLVSQCCTKMGNLDNGPVEASIRLTLVVPQTKAPQGDTHTPYDNPYQHEGSDNMLVLNDLVFVFYTEDGEYVTSASGKDKVVLGNVEYAAPYHRYNAELTVDGVVNGHTYRVVVLANRRQMYSGSLPFAVSSPLVFTKPVGFLGTDEQFLYSQLEFNSDAGDESLVKYTRLNLETYDEARVPMWGVQKINQIKVFSDGNKGSMISSGDIYLLRSIAKVKVSLSEDLSHSVKITDHVPGDAGTGAVMNYSRNKSYMAVSYAWAREVDSTPSTAGKDKVDGLYSNNHLNIDNDEVTGTYQVPMYKDPDGSYYMYLSEQKIGEASISLQFQYLDIEVSETVTTRKTLHFADYEAASVGKLDIPRTEEELAGYMFPVMRNHYYIYTITKLDPLELKYEVCEWNTKESGTINLGDLTEFNEWNKQHIHYSEGAFTTSYDPAQGTITITARANADVKSGANPTMKIDGYDAAVTRVGGFYEATVTHKFTQDWVADVEWHFPNEDGETYVIRHEHQIERKLTLLSYQDIWDMNQNDDVTKTVMMVNSVSNNASQGYVLGFDGRNAVSPAKSGLAFTSEEVIKNYIQNSGALYDQKYYFRLTREPQGIDLVSYVGGMSPDLKGSESVEWRSGENDHYFHLNQVTSDVANTATSKEYQVRISPKENTSLYLNAQTSPSALCYKPGTGNWSVWNFFEVTP